MRTTRRPSLSAATRRLGTGSRSTNGRSRGPSRISLGASPAEVRIIDYLLRVVSRTRVDAGGVTRQSQFGRFASAVPVGWVAPQLDQLEAHRIDLRPYPVEGSLVRNGAAENPVPTVDF